MKYVSGGELEEPEDYWNFMDGRITRNGGNNFIYTVEGVAADITEIFKDSSSFVIADPYIYINKEGQAVVYENLELADIPPALVGGGGRKGIVLAAEINNETGFGVVFRDFYSGINLSGFARDTVMNYPQNIFFDWLTADLAVKFRIALDMPTVELPALAEDYHDNLMKSLSRDAFKAQRINNAYSNRGVNYGKLNNSWVGYTNYCEAAKKYHGYFARIA